MRAGQGEMSATTILEWCDLYWRRINSRTTPQTNQVTIAFRHSFDSAHSTPADADN